MYFQVQVISYNTTRTQSSGGYLEGDPMSPISQVRYVESSPISPTSPMRYDIQPIEYSNTDVQRDVSHDTAVSTDVQESKEGDTEVGNIVIKMLVHNKPISMFSNKQFKDFGDLCKILETSVA